MRGLILLGEMVGQEQRPFSWVVGPQGVPRRERPSMRDAMREKRRMQTDLASPQGV